MYIRLISFDRVVSKQQLLQLSFAAQLHSVKNNVNCSNGKTPLIY